MISIIKRYTLHILSSHTHQKYIVSKHDNIDNGKYRWQFEISFTILFDLSKYHLLYKSNNIVNDISN